MCVCYSPRAVDPMGELGGDSPEDEGIQPDLHSLPRHSYTSSSRMSATSSALSFYSPVSPSVTMDTTTPSPTGDDTAVAGNVDISTRQGDVGGSLTGLDRETSQGGVVETSQDDSCVGGTGSEVGVAGFTVTEAGLKVAGIMTGEQSTGGGSLQDIRLTLSKETRKTNSAVNLRETGEF